MYSTLARKRKRQGKKRSTEDVRYIPTREKRLGMKKSRLTQEEVDAWVDKIVKDDLEREKTKSSLATRVIQVERDMKDLEKRMVSMNATLTAMWDNPLFDQYRSK